jgi:voltage-gated potassium channel
MPQTVSLPMLIVLIGVGFSLSVAGTVVQFMVVGRSRQRLGRKRLDGKLARLKIHSIIGGYRRISRLLTLSLRRNLVNRGNTLK